MDRKEGDEEHDQARARSGARAKGIGTPKKQETKESSRSDPTQGHCIPSIQHNMAKRDPSIPELREMNSCGSSVKAFCRTETFPKALKLVYPDSK